MKKLIAAVAMAVLFASCQKTSSVVPTTTTSDVQNASNKSSESTSLSSIPTIKYCTTTTMTTTDSWTIKINKLIVDVTAITYEVMYDVNGVSTGWLPVSSFPYNIGIGMFTGVTNIKIKETHTILGKDGNFTTVVEYFDVNPC